ncbi:MAG: cupin domain-containing protein [Burkholderiales bacterium]|nr:cupin domain-containing protein [Burkholderiales bacterium]
MTRPVRRIVTGHLADGRSTVLNDTPSPHVVRRAAGNGSTLLWVSDATPGSLDGDADAAARSIGVPPPDGGTIFRVAEFPPRLGVAYAPDNATTLNDFGIGADVLRGHAPRHPAIHRTRTVDYVVVLEGEIVLLLDDGEVTLKAGDTVVQRGTNHAWINRSDAVCRLAMVFVDAREPAVLKAR